MATLTIPAPVQAYFPKNIDPARLWVKYNSDADALIVYFTGKPVPSVWADVDQFAYIGFAQDDETVVTGVMIEHFSRWLLASDHPTHQLEPAH